MKKFLGDGCYIEYDGYSFILTTESGYETTNRIVLEPDVVKSLEDYINEVRFNEQD